jgi:hypothetical protein
MLLARVEVGNAPIIRDLYAQRVKALWVIEKK